MSIRTNKFGTTFTESTWKSGQEDSLIESEPNINDKEMCYFQEINDKILILNLLFILENKYY